MTLIEFTKRFPNEEACEQYIKVRREANGIVCPKCGCTHHYWKKNRKQWECKKCGHRTTLTSGTVMHNSKLPMMYWFLAYHLLTSTKKSFSAAEIQRQIGHKFYQPVWEMLHKIRRDMGKRESLYQLMGEIELDEGFFSTSHSEEEGTPIKSGRGTQRKSKVLVMVESTPADEANTLNKHKIKKIIGHIKMQVIPDLKAATIDERVAEAINMPSATLTTDGSSSYTHFKDNAKKHISHVVEPKQVSKVLPWVHITISNAKRQLLDIYHDIKPEYLQLYLDEFCYKFNRRNEADMFDNLFDAALSYKNDFMHRTYDKKVA
jgi:predicted RNA-binding Zn-ribbon protein involved in translation (DUF1610 family)